VELRVSEVADAVVELHESFFACGGCGKLYWMGSHWDKISKKYGS
jgi:uncharacterized protein with PIN domain